MYITFGWLYVSWFHSQGGMDWQHYALYVVQVALLAILADLK